MTPCQCCGAEMALEGMDLNNYVKLGCREAKYRQSGVCGLWRGVCEQNIVVASKNVTFMRGINHYIRQNGNLACENWDINFCKFSFVEYFCRVIKNQMLCIYRKTR